MGTKNTVIWNNYNNANILLKSLNIKKLKIYNKYGLKGPNLTYLTIWNNMVVSNKGKHYNNWLFKYLMLFNLSIIEILFI